MDPARERCSRLHWMEGIKAGFFSRFGISIFALIQGICWITIASINCGPRVVIASANC